MAFPPFDKGGQGGFSSVGVDITVFMTVKMTHFAPRHAGSFQTGIQFFSLWIPAEGLPT